MAFVLYLAVLLFAAGGVLFGLDLMTSPLPKMPPHVAIGRTVPQQHAARAPSREERGADERAEDRKLSPVYPASPGGNANADVRVVYAPTVGRGSDMKFVKPAPAAAQTFAAPRERRQPETSGAAARDSEPDKAQADAQPDAHADAKIDAVVAPALLADDQPQTSHATNRCDVNACAAAYLTFRAEDCTYQPFDGPRALCTKGDGGATVAQRQQPVQQPARQAAAQTMAPPPRQAMPAGKPAVQQARSRTAQQVRRPAAPPPARAEPMSETEAIVRRMTRGRDMGDIAVQRGDGSIVIIHTGDARAQVR